MGKITIAAILFCVLFTLPRSILASGHPLSVGDYIFVQGRFKSCQTRGLVAYTKVSEEGSATFFEQVSIEAEGRTPDSVLTDFLSEWQKLTGRAPKSLELKIVPSHQKEIAVKMMMGIHWYRKECQKFHDYDLPAPDWDRFYHFARGE